MGRSIFTVMPRIELGSDLEPNELRIHLATRRGASATRFFFAQGRAIIDAGGEN